MIRLLPLVSVALFWLAAAALFGWAGLAVMAAIGVAGELILFRDSWLEPIRRRRDRRTAYRRWRAWHG